jgi:predicted AAA+ superfamily ATPase
MLVPRNTYLQQIEPFINKPFIKIFAGIRRSGKSSILRLLRHRLLQRSVPDERILLIDYEDFETAALDTPKKLHDFIEAKLPGDEPGYLLLDEIQRLDGWENVVNSLFAKNRLDIYITGSNSKLLSSELATLLTGRYVEFPIQTLSLAETLDFCESPASEAAIVLDEYLRIGGFPGIQSIASQTSEVIYRAIKDIYSSIVLLDVVERNKIRNIDTLERLVRFLFDNVGNLFSAKKISGYLISQGRKVSEETVYNYIYALEGAYVIIKAPRYDIQGKAYLSVQEKYYAADIGLIHSLVGQDVRRLPGVLENVVFNELRLRGYEVGVGKLADKEVDFVAQKAGEKLYVQVCYQLGIEQSTIDREFGPLLAIPDQYPKYVVSLDSQWNDNYEGVQRLHLADFLLGRKQ